MAKKRNLSDLIRDEVAQNLHLQLVLDKATTPACPELKHWIETYSPSKKKSYIYYRYVYREKGTLHYHHISGGNTKCERASLLKEKVSDAIKSGNSPQLIIAIIAKPPSEAVAPPSNL